MSRSVMGWLQKPGREQKVRGGLKINNAALRHKIFRIILIMLILMLQVRKKGAKLLKMGRKLTFSLHCGTRTRTRDCDLVCEITDQLPQLHLR